VLQVLIVDDSKLSRSMAVRAVASMGHTVWEATDGQHAVETLERQSVDLVITDLLMPVLGGFELIERIRQIRPNLPVVVVSADVQLTSRERGEELGCVAFLRKPVNPQELAEVIQGVLSTGGVACD
jgi:CheY-like chemotaxis protein